MRNPAQRFFGLGREASEPERYAYGALEAQREERLHALPSDYSPPQPRSLNAVSALLMSLIAKLKGEA